MAKAKGSPKTGGRKKGTPNIMTRELKEICRHEAPTLVKELIRLATGAESEAVRVAAIKEMFDRGFGKATQPIEGSMTYGVSEQLAELFKENASGSLGGELARALPPPNGHQSQYCLLRSDARYGGGKLASDGDIGDSILVT